jgi:hypothetical protein
LKVPQGSTDVLPEIVSYYHPNLTINVVDDHTRWVPGSVPQPMDKCTSTFTPHMYVALSLPHQPHQPYQLPLQYSTVCTYYTGPFCFSLAALRLICEHS